MNFVSLLQKVESSKEFKRFKEEHPDAELCIGFFIINYENEMSQEQIDYKTKDGVFSFYIQNNEIKFNKEEIIETDEKKELKQISSKINIDIDELKELVREKLIEENINLSIEKIIAILQMHENQQVWNLTIILHGLIIINILIDSSTKQIIKFDRKNLSDFIKRI